MEITQDYDNRTIGDTKWTNRRELNSLTEYYDESASSFRDKFAILDRIDGNKKKDNIYLILGNATRQLYRVFKEKNVNFMHSKVKSSIVYYFNSLETEAMIHFSDYVKMIAMYVNDLEKSVSTENKNNSFIDKIPFLKQKENRIVPVLNKEKIQKELDIYNNIANQIAFFDIEKDIEKAVNNHLDWMMSKEEFTGLNINKEIDSINQELSSLGINKRIDYRDNNKEKNNNFDDSLKKVQDKNKELEEFLKNEYNDSEIAEESSLGISKENDYREKTKELDDKVRKELEKSVKNGYKDDAETAEIIEIMEKYKNDINQSDSSIDNKTGRRL